jgi:hypothetical protein
MLLRLVSRAMNTRSSVAGGIPCMRGQGCVVMPRRVWATDVRNDAEVSEMP